MTTADQRLLESDPGQPLETLFTVTLFTGMREGEVLGLMWDCVDFEAGTITVNKQLQLHEAVGGGAYQLGSTKNGKGRSITPAASVMALLKRHRAAQAAQRLRAGKLWQDTGFVFTDELGQPFAKATVYRAFKRAAAVIGRRTPAFTICGTPMPWQPSGPGTISRPSRRPWDTPQRPLPWMSTATSQSR